MKIPLLSFSLVIYEVVSLGEGWAACKCNQEGRSKHSQVLLRNIKPPYGSVVVQVNLLLAGQKQSLQGTVPVGQGENAASSVDV